MSNNNEELNNDYALAHDIIDKYAQLNANAWKNITESQFNFVNLWTEYLNTYLQQLANVKTPNDILAIESDLVSEYSEKFSGNMQEASNKLIETQSELMNYFFADLKNHLPIAAQSQEDAGKVASSKNRKKPSRRKATV